MIDSIRQFLMDNLSPELCIFVISLLPILELRGGIIAAVLLQVDWYIALPLCILGNILPIPFVLLFIRKIFRWLKKLGPIARVVEKIEKRAMKKSKAIENGSMIGLLLFVAIPLPGTGAWTGSLVADLLDMPVRRSLPIIFAGVIIAGLIMTIAAYSFGVILFN